MLWDLFDSADDDQFATGAGRRDHLSLGFDPIWKVIRNFDPGNGHTHPVSIHDLWDGLRATRFSDINRVSEVYREHNILKPQPDLEITMVQIPPGRVSRGASFSIISTVHNRGDEAASTAFSVGFRLTPVPSSILQPVALGSRTVAAGLIAGSCSTAAVTPTIPAGTAFGVYNLQVCADSGHAIPESDESNNCGLATGTIAVVP